MNFSLTIVIPTYNSIAKMTETIASLDATSRLLPTKVVFVDDCSKDDTFPQLEALCAERPDWSVTRLDQNSGTAARPRNRGMDLADTEYVFFLDSDDILIPNGVKVALDYAVKHGSDVVRSSLVVRHGDGTEERSDRVPRWDSLDGLTSQVKAITRHQSLTCSSLFKRRLLVDNEIRFDETRRIGEDTVFTAAALSVAQKVAYRDAPIRKYVRAAVGEESITQKINSRQFADFVRSWEEAEGLLERRNVSFMRERGFAALNYALRQFVWFGVEPLGQEDFDLFSQFTKKHWHVIQHFPIRARFRELVEAALQDDREGFNERLKRRLVIAGHDLKFMRDLIPRLQEVYNVRIDQWTGLNSHDESASRACLEWGDLFWAEWLLGAAVWYSKHVRSDQRLVVRAHRTEIGVDFGLKINRPAVSAYIAIAPHTLGDFSDRFDIPREKFHLIPNIFDIDSYARGQGVDRLNKIAMVGILPRLKRFDLGIQLFSRLREKLPTLKLVVYGKRPEEVDWLQRDDDEREFFENCEKMLEELGLRDHVIFPGWSDLKQELAGIGAVVSFSDYEGMQVAVGEAYCANTIAVMRNWRGASACYPGQFVFNDEESMLEFLEVMLTDPKKHEIASNVGLEFMRMNYDPARTMGQVFDLLDAVRA